MNLTVRRRPLNLEAQNRSQVLFVKIVVCKVALREAFFRLLRLSTVIFISPVLQCRRHLYVSSKRKEVRNLRNFQEPILFQKWDTWEHLAEKDFYFRFERVTT